MQPKLIIPLLLITPLTSNAEIFAREDFNYTPGNLAGNFGGLGWLAEWTNVEGTPLVAAGKGRVTALPGQEGARLVSTLQEPPPGDTKVVWISFEGQQFTNMGATDLVASYGGLGLYKGGQEQLLIGKSWGGDYQWRAGTGQGLVGPATPVSTLSRTFIIARITMVDGIATANDTLDVWLNPADFSTVAALGAPQISRTDPDLSFDTLRIRAGSGDGRITAESWEFDAVTAGDTLADVVASDSDGDGMLDAWELANGLIVGVNDSQGDPDADGSLNLQEFQRSTNPQNRDTDGDGLADGVESGTGVFVGAQDTGTSPTLIDTDGDGLYDNEESNSGVFVSEFAPGTNPNLADTDGDVQWDYFEVTRGTDPNDPLSFTPVGDLTFVGADDFSYDAGAIGGRSGGTGFDYDNSMANDSFVGHTGLGFSDWDDVFGVSEVAGGKLITMDSGAKREFNGPGEGVVVGGDEHNGAINQEVGTVGRVVYFRADLRRSAGATWSGISAYDFGAERVFAGVNSAPNPVSGKFEFSFGAPAATAVYSGIEALPNRDYTLVLKLDYENDLASFWLDPDLDGPEPTPTLTIPFTLGNWTTAGRLGSGGSGACEWDHFVVGRAWSALGVFPGVSGQGGDFAEWIAGFPAVGTETGVNADPDRDGLANAIEQVLGTRPDEASQGLREIARVGGVFRFRHSRNNSPASDISASYEWSTDLVSWHASGEANAGGVTASIGSTVITDEVAPLNDEVEVSLTIEAGSAARAFIRLKATQ
jgi:hypothetical protein